MATINFETISYKNFLSTGNSPITIYLNKSKTTLIVGKNGEGKTTLLDALTFVLFGKPYRNVKLGQLVNSINGKHCEVSVDFKIGDRSYRVIRGLKPNKLEIFENNILLNKEASSKDYQKILEQQILRLNYKTFVQLVVLGATTFIPFMQLKATQRREVVEDILDINIFSTMNQLLKERVSSSKVSLQTINTEIDLLKTKIKSQKTIIESLSKAKDQSIQTIQTKIESNSAQIQEATISSSNLIDKIQTELDNISELDSTRDMLSETTSKIVSNNRTIELKQKQLDFFEDNHTCPTCNQEIDSEHRKSCSHSLSTEINREQKIVDNLIAERDRLNVELSNLLKIKDTIGSYKIDLSTINNTIKHLNLQNKQYEEEIDSIRSTSHDIDNEKLQLKKYANQVVSKIEGKNLIMQERQIQDACTMLLKDSGIKIAIIREYLPVMNQMINYYLNVMDTYIKFELDESFSETIKSRYRDEFTYDSFSEGEKKRIDVSILFAWRHIAKLKNSVNTNLLLMDELFDGSLDDSGTEFLMQLINEISKDTNVFIISHKGDILLDKFHSVLRIEKRKNFSVIA